MLYTIIDIETTGLNPVNDDILSVGYIRIGDDFKVYSNGVLYFYKPNFSVESPAQKIHELQRSFLQEYEGQFDENLVKLYTLYSGCNFIGKNSNGFDIPFIKNFLSKYSMNTYYGLVPEVNASFDIQDYVSKVYRERNNTTRRGKLHEYAEMYGITDEQVKKAMSNLPNPINDNVHYHGALWDCMVTYLVLYAYCKSEGVSL